MTQGGACRRWGEGMQGTTTKTLNTGGLKSTLQITHFTTFEDAFS